MWIFNFYRFYIAVLTGGLAYFFLYRKIWLWLAISIVIRSLWFFIEQTLNNITMDRQFSSHIPHFKQQFGPYGIRLANKAESDRRIKKSLVEVFINDTEKLKKNVEQLEVMDALFQAGMRPQGDEYLLHDLKLKYGKNRLEIK